VVLGLGFKQHLFMIGPAPSDPGLAASTKLGLS
jgi:hypothetical protein